MGWKSGSLAEKGTWPHPHFSLAWRVPGPPTGPCGVREGQTRLDNPELPPPWCGDPAPGAPALSAIHQSWRRSRLLMATVQRVASCMGDSNREGFHPVSTDNQSGVKLASPSFTLSHWGCPLPPSWPALGVWWGLTGQPREDVWGQVSVTWLR